MPSSRMPMPIASLHAAHGSSSPPDCCCFRANVCSRRGSRQPLLCDAPTVRLSGPVQSVARMEAIIIGGGIGGLTLALALHAARAARRIRVFEAAGELRALGVGINLGPH